MTTDLETTLQRLWGFSSFRPGQREVVEAVIQGQPVVAIMPTGAGKSLCYQLPAVMGRGTTLVVSPLIALMKDQVDSLDYRGVPATFINSQVAPEDRKARFRGLREGHYKLVYLAPERLRHENLWEWLQQCPIERMAIDEAHCISQWGHDFRPDYQRLGDVAARIGIPQICAFTATATQEVRDDIIRSLDLANPRIFVHGFRRHNLILRVLPIRKQRHKLDHIVALQKECGGSGIVYATARKRVEEVAAELTARGVSALPYHAGLSDDERTAAQDQFMCGRVTVMVATNAFGMGVDKPDTRFVVHHDVPGSIEAYYQEAGRAGRDGEPAECAILFTYADVRTQEFFIDKIGEESSDKGAPLDFRKVERLQALEKNKLKRMVRYCYTEECRHQTLLDYFGERQRQTGPCGACDNCLATSGTAKPRWLSAGGSETASAGSRTSTKTVVAQTPAPGLLRPRTLAPDELIAVRKLLSGVARGRGQFTSEQLTSILRGEAKGVPADLVSTPTFGSLAHWTASDLLSLSKSLQSAGALEWLGDRPPRVRLTAEGVQIMRGQSVPALALAPLSRAENESTVDPLLFEALREARRKEADQRGLPPFVVAHDAVLKEIATLRPTTIDALVTVKGIGPKKAQEYGAVWIDVVKRFR